MLSSLDGNRLERMYARCSSAAASASGNTAGHTATIAELRPLPRRPATYENGGSRSALCRISRADSRNAATATGFVSLLGSESHGTDIHNGVAIDAGRTAGVA